MRWKAGRRRRADAAALTRGAGCRSLNGRHVEAASALLSSWPPQLQSGWRRGRATTGGKPSPSVATARAWPPRRRLRSHRRAADATQATDILGPVQGQAGHDLRLPALRRGHRGQRALRGIALDARADLVQIACPDCAAVGGCPGPNAATLSTPRPAFQDGDFGSSRIIVCAGPALAVRRLAAGGCTSTTTPSSGSSPRRRASASTNRALACLNRGSARR
jgi:hypothetical protein